MLGRHVAEQGRLDEEAALGRAGRDLAFGEQQQPVAMGLAEATLDALQLARADQRPAVEIAFGGAGIERVEAFRDLGDEAVVDPVLDQQPRAGRAGLAGVMDRSVDDDRQGLVEIGIGEHDLRRPAAELEGDRAAVLRPPPAGPGRRPRASR